MKSERKSRQISSNEDWREGRTDFRQWKSDGRADRFPAMKNEWKGKRISSNENRTEGKTGFQQSKVKRLDWDGTLQVMPYRPYLGFKSRRPLRQRDRLPNFRDSGLDFAGLMERKQRTDFRQENPGRKKMRISNRKKRDGSGGTIG